MNYKKNLIDSISKWVIENKRVVAGVHDVKKYNIVPLPDGDICIQCTVNGHKYHPRFESLNVNFLKAIWHEIENIRLKETAVDKPDEVKMDYRKLLLDELNKHWGDFNVLTRDSKFMTTDTEKHVTWVIEHLQETIAGIIHNRIISEFQMQKVKEYLQDKEYVITEVEIIKYISSKLPTFKANEYPNLANVIELTLSAGYYDSSDLTQTFVKVKEFFEKDRYKELYEILKG